MSQFKVVSVSLPGSKFGISLFMTVLLQSLHWLSLSSSHREGSSIPHLQSEVSLTFHCFSDASPMFLEASSEGCVVGYREGIPLSPSRL